MGKEVKVPITELNPDQMKTEQEMVSDFFPFKTFHQYLPN